jgi:hypothetical protein
MPLAVDPSGWLLIFQARIKNNNGGEMAEYWAERQRRTNRLAGIAADYIFSQDTIEPNQLYGLCKLTWITDSYSDDNAKYISSTKIPALGLIFQRDYQDWTLDDVAADVSAILNVPVDALILKHTGFTNFYKAYRNSSAQWIAENYETLLPLFKDARNLLNDSQGFDLIEKVEGLPTIPKANHEEQGMHPEYLLTPIFFALDNRIRFPLINGNAGVKKLLTALKVTSAPLTVQYQSMIGLYGTGGIKDAADLDQVGRDLPDFIDIPGRVPTKQLLETKPTDGNAELPLKDEADIITIQEARQVVNKRIHNRLTNKLKECLAKFTLFEGRDKNIMFDVLVKEYDEAGNDLLIEVKSSIESAHIRMAIGQVFDYWFRAKGDTERHVAILLPEIPGEEMIKLLEHLEIGVLWFSGDKLRTCNDWLGILIDLDSTGH